MFQNEKNILTYIKIAFIDVISEIKNQYTHSIGYTSMNILKKIIIIEFNITE